MESRFVDKLNRRWAQGLLVCVGLDSAIAQLPAHLQSVAEPQLSFNEEVIDETIDAAAAYKLNLAFYLETGPEGLVALERSIDGVRKRDSDVPVILDAKFGDIGSTNAAYARFAFDRLDVDAITVSPYVGRTALDEFLAYRDRTVLVLSRTSNPGSEEIQGSRRFSPGRAPSVEQPLYELIAAAVAAEWNSRGNCGLVVGATAPAELQQCRALVGDMPILVPGIGAQGGDLMTTLTVGLGQESIALLINASRSLIFASADNDFAQASRLALDALNAEIAEVLEARPS